MKKIKFINSYSYLFSARPGTPAYSLKPVNQEDAKKRLINFQNIASEIKNFYKSNLINKTVKVLFENKVNNENKYFGRDEYFNAVIVENNENLIGKIKNIKIFKNNQNTLFGETFNLNHSNHAA